MAAAVQRHPGGKNVKRQHIELLESGRVGHPRYIAALAAAMETTVDALLGGIGHTASDGSVNDSGVTNITTLTEQPAQSGNMSDRQSNLTPEIPPTMPYSPHNLRSAIVLLGDLLGNLDDDNKEIVGGMLNKLALAPHKAKSIAHKAWMLANSQSREAVDETMNKVLTSKSEKPYETDHGPLR